jgi:nicotinamide mononucleotide (NMN) deamidase PncC
MTAAARRALVRRVHASTWRGALAVTGGGSLLISELLTEPGASATVLEARVPYHAGALAEWIGATPEQATSAATARAMAMAALDRAHALAPDETHVFGLALTASLATRTRKRGAHRVHVALQTPSATRTWAIALEKGARGRAGEETVCRDVGLAALSTLLGDDPSLHVDVRADERIEAAAFDAPPEWGALWAGAVAAVSVPDRAPLPLALLPGAFNPLHDGHRAMARHAAARLRTPVAYELCVRNVDKPPLDYLTVHERLSQFGGTDAVWLTRAPTFVEKARRFPGVAFVVGIDTIARIADVRYYGDDPDLRDQAITEMRTLGVSFLVFGRRTADRFLALEDLELPGALQALCTGVGEAEFRNDLSSTALRGAGGSEKGPEDPPAPLSRP